MKNISAAKLGKQLNISTAQLFGLLQEKNLIERKDESWSLTQAGETAGGEYKKHPQHGAYIAWPESFGNEYGKAESNMSATGLGEHFELPARRINRILSELGWVKPHLKGWLVTSHGQRVGGAQRENSKSGVPYVTWQDSLTGGVSRFYNF